MSSTSRNFEGFQGGRGAGGRALPQSVCAKPAGGNAEPQEAGPRSAGGDLRGLPEPGGWARSRAARAALALCACLHKRPHEGPRNAGSGTLATRGPSPPRRLAAVDERRTRGRERKTARACTRARPKKKRRAFQRPAASSVSEFRLAPPGAPRPSSSPRRALRPWLRPNTSKPESPPRGRTCRAPLPECRSGSSRAACGGPPAT